MAYPLPSGERVRVRAGNDLIITPTLILPHQGGGKFFKELDAPQLCCGVLHFLDFDFSLAFGFLGLTFSRSASVSFSLIVRSPLRTTR